MRRRRRYLMGRSFNLRCSYCLQRITSILPLLIVFFFFRLSFFLKKDLNWQILLSGIVNIKILYFHFPLVLALFCFGFLTIFKLLPSSLPPCVAYTLFSQIAPTLLGRLPGVNEVSECNDVDPTT